MKLILLILLTFNVNAKTFSTLDLSKSAINKDCLDYCVDGACFWLVCTFWGCSVKTTPHISHNLPDFVVTSYNHPGENPFTEFKAFDYESGIDGGHVASREKHNDDLKFKEASVIGNPVAYALGRQRYFCDSDVKPMTPYYLSTFDNKAWRSGITEMLYPSTFVPGMNEIGPFLKSWGSIYPRVGFLHQKNDYKASSVIAERALDIVSNGGVHIYQPTTSSAQFKENGKWQMIRPNPENQCKKFGYEDHQTTLDKRDDDGQYAWTAWRRYSCCIPGPGSFIGSTITGCIN